MKNKRCQCRDVKSYSYQMQKEIFQKWEHVEKKGDNK